MGCSNCSSEGCGKNGHCDSGGCNKMNTYDWISTLDINDPNIYSYIEVSFKNGARKDFFKCKDNIYNYHTGDMVVVECSPGYDVGQITLMGDLVRLQMKKKSVSESSISNNIVRVAGDKDLDKLRQARELESKILSRSRAIARSLGLEMKLGDIEYQADLKKATFFYTANGRVDFRELVRAYAKEFRIKIEMRQIGSRQESARIGGMGSCGRELCCSTWLSDFKSVNTSAARYQNISINQTKLSGQCGRLKCCLNYELDTYLDALKDFPKKADVLRTKKGKAILVKTDIFKGLMYYIYDDILLRGAFHPLDKNKVKEILAMNKKGEMPEDLVSMYENTLIESQEKEVDFADVTGVIELPNDRKKRRKSRSKSRKPDNKKSNTRNNSSDKKENEKQGGKPQNKNSKNPPSSNKGNRKKSTPNKGGQNTNKTKEGSPTPKKDGPKNNRNKRNSKPRNQKRNNNSNNNKT